MSELTPMQQEIDEFLKTDRHWPPNKWFSDDRMRVYLRRNYSWQIEVASVEVEAAFQKQGIFTNFLTWLETYGRDIVVENVMNPILRDFLIRRGYTLIGPKTWESNLSGSFIRRAQKMEHEELYYIQDSRKVVGNCLCFWALEGKGYTCDLDLAQKYTKVDAERLCANRKTDRMWPVSKVDAVASRYVDIQKLKGVD